MPPDLVSEDLDSSIEEYYGENSVTAIITLKADTKLLDQLAENISKFSEADDVFLVTGDTDIVIKARFPSYVDLKNFILTKVANLEGIKDTKTLMAVTTYKESGIIRNRENYDQ